MNYIISILMFVIMATASFVVGTHFEGDPQKAFNIIGGILSDVTVIFMFACMFNNMMMRQDIKEHINKFFKISTDIETMEANLQRIKTEFTDYFTKLYPEHEKDIFSKISPHDAEQLSIYLAKYPELKFNNMIEQLVTLVSDQMNNIIREKQALEECRTDILNKNQSGWLLFKVNVSIPDSGWVYMKVTKG